MGAERRAERESGRPPGRQRLKSSAGLKFPEFLARAWLCPCGKRGPVKCAPNRLSRPAVGCSSARSATAVQIFDNLVEREVNSVSVLSQTGAKQLTWFSMRV